LRARKRKRATMRTDGPTENEARGGRVGAVVLAAGSSVRMGASKALLPWGARPMIGQVVATLQAAGDIGPVVVVTGAQAERVAAAVAGYGVRCVHNGDYAAGGMLSSVGVGMRAIAGEVDAIMLVLGDQPAVRAGTVREIAEAWRRSRAALAIPTYAGRRGHPVVFSAGLGPEIQALRAPQTLRDLVHRHLDGALLRAVDDPGVVGDVDTPEDYRRALARWEQEQGQAG
jgi:molybdenum cofactor cytidylyltransferase